MGRALAILRPPPELTISDWADANRRLSSEASAEPGQWRTSRAEYQRGIMDAISDAGTESVVIMSSAQVGKALAIDTPIATPAGWTGIDAAKFERPPAHRLVGGIYAALGQEVVDVAIAQREAEVEPDRVLDGRGREAVTGVGQGAHHAPYPAIVMTATRVNVLT